MLFKCMRLAERKTIACALKLKTALRHSMLKIALGAEFNSEKMYKDVAELASKYKGVQLHTHVAENPVSRRTCPCHQICPPNRPLTHSLTHLLTLSVSQSVTHPPTHPFIHSFSPSFIQTECFFPRGQKYRAACVCMCVYKTIVAWYPQTSSNRSLESSQVCGTWCST